MARAGWGMPAWYLHKEPGNRHEHIREGDQVRHIPTSEPRSWLHMGQFGVWEIDLMKYAGEFNYHERVKFWKAGPAPISLFDSLAEAFSPPPIIDKNETSNGFVNKIEIYLEGQNISVEQTLYERNPEARKKCIGHYGLGCQVCGLNFGQVYGSIGEGFIHVHHINPVSTKGGEYEVDPIVDLIPICPNCHAMAHRRNPPFSIDELKRLHKGGIR